MMKRINKWLKKLLLKDHISEFSFDQKYAINTFGYYDLEAMNNNEQLQEHGHDYQGTPIKILQYLIDKVPANLPAMTFIDYGAGMGRTLFLASEIGFKQIIGIEYCEEFYQQLSKNIQDSTLSQALKERMKAIQIDAVDFKLPQGDCILYFFNPFDEALLKPVINHIVDSYSNNPREIYVIYYNPWYRGEFDKIANFKVVSEGNLRFKSLFYKYYKYVIYKVKS